PVTAKSYLSILADNGFKPRSFDLNQIEDLMSYKPGIIIIGTRDGSEPLKLSPALTSYLTSGKVKFIGMGWLGAKVFEELEPHQVLAQVANGFDSLILLDPKAPPDITVRLPTAEPVRVYD